MKERPIIMAGRSVRALRAGTKTQTRRIIRPQPVALDAPWPTPNSHVTFADLLAQPDYYIGCGYCSYGVPGDRLWLKESWRVEARHLHRDGPPTYLLDYAADSGSPTLTPTHHPDAARYVRDRNAYRSPRFMPRWACRLVVEIVALRPEPLQSISFEDAQAEGWRGKLFGYGDLDGETPRNEFIEEWNALNVARGHGWARNEWVWVIQLRRIDGEISAAA